MQAELSFEVNDSAKAIIEQNGKTVVIFIMQEKDGSVVIGISKPDQNFDQVQIKVIAGVATVRHLP